MYTMIPYRFHREISDPVDFGDRFFRSLFDMDPVTVSREFRMDVRESADAYHLEAEMPGVDPDAISLSLDNDVLTVSADINTETCTEKGNCLYSERRTGHMERAFNLEGIRQDDITASYNNGVLDVTLPKEKAEQKKEPRRIAITRADGSAQTHSEENTQANDQPAD